MMAITLELSSHEGKTQCLLSADGYQTYDRIVCSAELANNNMVIKFKSYTDGKVLNPIGVEEYKVGETLFKIKQAPDKSGAGTIRYLTHWEAYTPFGTDRTNLKDYFEKIK